MYDTEAAGKYLFRTKTIDTKKKKCKEVPLMSLLFPLNKSTYSMSVSY